MITINQGVIMLKKRYLIAVVCCLLFYSFGAFTCAKGECKKTNDSECKSHCEEKCGGCSGSKPQCSNSDSACKSKCSCNCSGCPPKCKGNKVTSCSKGEPSQSTCANQWMDNGNGTGGTQCKYGSYCYNGGGSCKK